VSTGSIAAKGRRAGQSPWVERFGRAGLVAKGVLYGVVAILAIDVALGSRKESPDRNGALRTIAEQPFGKVLLIVLAAGLAGYATWQLALAILDRDNEGEGAKGLAKRAGALARAGWYGVLCWLTVSTLVGNGSGNSNEQQRTAGIFDHTGGRYLVYAAGLAFIGAAAFNGYRAITCKFNKKLKQGEMNEAEEAAATGVGILGHLARCVVFGLIGIFLVKAAWEFDSTEARGLDGALLEVAQQPYGGLLLGAVAVGLLAYGFFCFAQARYRRI
jgi:Domain of Unknown Function (DUF1206)